MLSPDEAVGRARLCDAGAPPFSDHHFEAIMGHGGFEDAEVVSIARFGPVELAGMERYRFQYQWFSLLAFGYEGRWFLYIPESRAQSRRDGSPVTTLPGLAWPAPDDPLATGPALGDLVASRLEWIFRDSEGASLPAATTVADFAPLVARALEPLAAAGDPDELATTIAAIDLLARFGGCGNAELELAVAHPESGDREVIRGGTSWQRTIGGTMGGWQSTTAAIEIGLAGGLSIRRTVTDTAGEDGVPLS